MSTWTQVPGEPHIYLNSKTGKLQVHFRSRKAGQNYNIRRRANTLTEARTVRAQIQQELSQKGGTLTVQAFYRTEWIPYKSKRVQPHTLKRYKQLLERDLLPLLGDLPVNQITKGEGVKLTDRLLDDANRGIINETSIRNSWSAIKLFMNDLVDMDVIESNPFARIKIDTITRRAREPNKWQALTIDECIAFLEATRWVDAVQDIAALWISLSSGLHFAEYTALTWDNIDWSAESITVAKTQVDGNINHRAKTRYRKRTVYMFPAVAELLRKVKAEYPNSQWVIPNMHGNIKRFHSGTVKALKKTLTQAEITKPMTLHKLRSQFNTLCLQAGIQQARIKVVMGHSGRADLTSVYNLARDLNECKQVQVAAVGHIIAQAAKSLGLPLDSPNNL